MGHRQLGLSAILGFTWSPTPGAALKVSSPSPAQTDPGRPPARRALTGLPQLPEPIEHFLQAGVIGAGLPRVGQSGTDAGQQPGARTAHGAATPGWHGGGPGVGLPVTKGDCVTAVGRKASVAKAGHAPCLLLTSDKRFLTQIKPFRLSRAWPGPALFDSCPSWPLGGTRAPQHGLQPPRQAPAGVRALPHAQSSLRRRTLGPGASLSRGLVAMATTTRKCPELGAMAWGRSRRPLRPPASYGPRGRRGGRGGGAGKERAARGGEQPGYGAACGAAAEHGALRIVRPMK